MRPSTVAGAAMRTVTIRNHGRTGQMIVKVIPK